MAPEEKSRPSPPRGSPSCRRLSPTVVPRPFRTRTRRTCRCLPWTTRGFRSRLRSRSGCCWPRSQRSVSSQAAADVAGRNRCEVLSLRMQVSVQKGGRSSSDANWRLCSHFKLSDEDIRLTSSDYKYFNPIDNTATIVQRN